jgi:hypothetical protein
MLSLLAVLVCDLSTPSEGRHRAILRALTLAEQ